MSIKAQALKHLKALREYAELKKNNPEEATKVKYLINIKESCDQLSLFLRRMNNSKDKIFGSIEAYNTFISNNREVFKADKVPVLGMDHYGNIDFKGVDFERVFEIIDSQLKDKEEIIDSLYQDSDPKFREINHPLSDVVANIKNDVDALYQDDDFSKQIKQALDYANEEIVEKIGENIVDEVIDVNSQIRIVEAHNNFKDYIEKIGLDNTKVVNDSKSPGSIAGGFVNKPKNIEAFKPFLELEPVYQDGYKNKLLELDRLLNDEGLLNNAGAGESGSKEYGLVDYFQKNYRLKAAIVDYTKLTNEEEKKAALVNINNLSNDLKEVSSKYDKVFKFIEKNFDLDNITFPGNVYSGRPAEVKNGNIENWKPNLPPKYDFENSLPAVFLSGFTQLRTAAKIADVPLKEFIDHSTKSFLNGAKKLVEEDTNKLYLPRSEENTLGKRMAHVLYYGDKAYGALSAYSMSGGRGMEFLYNTSKEKKDNQIGNVIKSSIVKDYNIIHELKPINLFGRTDQPDIGALKNLFLAGDETDKLYEVSPKYYKENGESGNIVTDYVARIRKLNNTPIDEEYKKIINSIKDFCTERKEMHNHSGQYLKEGEFFELYSAGSLLLAGRQFFLDYIRENKLSITSIQDEKTRKEILDFITDPVKTFTSKHYKVTANDAETINQMKRGFNNSWERSIRPNNASFIAKFNECNNKPNGYNVGKTMGTIVADNKGGWLERLRGSTSKEYKALEKVAIATTTKESPTYVDKEALYVCAKNYKAYKLPDGTGFDKLSKTSKKRIEFCDAIIEAYEADKKAKELAENPQPVVQNNNIIQQDFQDQLQADVAPKQVKVVNPVNKGNKNEEKDPPDNEDNGVEP